MYVLLIILMVILSVLMCGIVLIQNSKGGGLASGFASSNQIMGVRKTTDVIEKTTWTLAALLVIFSVASAFCLGGPKQGSESIVKDMKTTAPAPAPAAQPAPAAKTTPAAPAAPAPAAPSK